MNKTLEQGISDIVGCLIDPIIVFPGGWGDTIPEWLKTAITLERMIGDMKALKRGEPTGTDAECCAYLYTLALTQPLDSDTFEIHMYIFTKTMRRWKKDTEVPPDLVSESLSDYHTDQLRHLKRWIYERRIKYRKEGENAH